MQRCTSMQRGGRAQWSRKPVRPERRGMEEEARSAKRRVSGTQEEASCRGHGSKRSRSRRPWPGPWWWGRGAPHVMPPAVGVSESLRLSGSAAGKTLSQLQRRFRCGLRLSDAVWRCVVQQGSRGRGARALVSGGAGAGEALKQARIDCASALAQLRESRRQRKEEGARWSASAARWAAAATARVACERLSDQIRTVDLGRLPRKKAARVYRTIYYYHGAGAEADIGSRGAGPERSVAVSPEIELSWSCRAEKPPSPVSSPC
jgi:hypothetical protein